MSGSARNNPRSAFYQIVQDAVRDVTDNGFESAEQMNAWLEKIQAAAEAAMLPESEMEAAMRESLEHIYDKMIKKGGILQMHPGISRFTLAQVEPRLRAALEKRIMANANLIKLNRQQAIAKTLQRFSGWMSSVPAGGTNVKGTKVDAKVDISKSLKSLPFVERRVLIDQGHKFSASLSETLAEGTGAIAGRWRSNFRQANYDYRHDHKLRDNKVYLLRESWATQQGLVKPGVAGYIDQITRPAEEPYCRCYYIWLYSPSELPSDMLTEKGRNMLKAARAKIRMMA